MNQAGNSGGGVGLGDAGVLALLTDTARAGRGGSYGVGGLGGEGWYGHGGPFATPSANAVRINRNSQQINDEARHNDINRVCERLNVGFSGIESNTFQAELRTSDRLQGITQEMNANARKADECCCEIQKEIIKGDAGLSRQISEVESRISLQQCKDTSAIISEIKAVESRDVERDLNAANAELMALKTQIACGCNCNGNGNGGGHRNP